MQLEDQFLFDLIYKNCNTLSTSNFKTKICLCTKTNFNQKMTPATEIYIPSEIILQILEFTFLPGYSHTNYSLVCSEWNHLVNQIIKTTKTVVLEREILYRNTIDFSTYIFILNSVAVAESWFTIPLTNKNNAPRNYYESLGIKFMQPPPVHPKHKPQVFAFLKKFPSVTEFGGCISTWQFVFFEYLEFQKKGMCFEAIEKFNLLSGEIWKQWNGKSIVGENLSKTLFQ